MNCLHWEETSEGSDNLTDNMTTTNTDDKWPTYYDAIGRRPARDTLLKAFEHIEADPNSKNPGNAIDLGCGSGVDTIPMLERGWRVLAIDSQPEGIRRLIEAVPPECAERLTTACAPFQEVELPAADLVNASFSLPFCPPEQYPSLWGNILGAIRPGGRFCGQFFGPNDTWANQADITFHSRKQVMDLLEEFVLEFLHERDEDGATATGTAKHWHVFSVVGRRR